MLPVPFAPRLIARLIDCIIIFCIAMLIVAPFMDQLKLQTSNYTYLVFLLFGWFIYYPLLESTGGTIGKRILRIESIDLYTGKPPTFLKAFSRSIILTFPLILLILIAVISKAIEFEANYTIQFLSILFVVWMILAPIACLWDNKGQSWHDKYSNILVVSHIKPSDKRIQPKISTPTLLKFRISYKPILLAILSILILLALLNPSYKQFKEFSTDITTEKREVVCRRTLNAFVFSIYEKQLVTVYKSRDFEYEEPERYYGFCLNFFKIK